MPKAPLQLLTTTLWDYPSQHYDSRHESQHQGYVGATPAYIIWNLLQRYTRPKDLVVDPMCGSGTSLVVAREQGRRALGYDLNPAHPDVFRADARKLPLENEKVDFAFVDPPYSDHIRYSGRPECIGELSALAPEYYASLEQVICEMHRVLRPERYAALYVHDSFEKGKPFMPIGFRLFGLMEKYFIAVDQIAIVRHNRTLLKNHFHTAAVEHNYYLRGYGHLFVFYKPGPKNPLPYDRRNPEERAQQIAAYAPKGGASSEPGSSEQFRQAAPRPADARPQPAREQQSRGRPPRRPS